MEAEMKKAPSPATVIATIALSVALVGGAYAATALPKNSVGSKQIKKGAVKGKDLAKKAVGGKHIKPDAVTGDKVRDKSLTAADIDESTLTGVDAARVNGSQVLQISYSAAANSPDQELFSVAGLTVSAACPGPADDFVNVTAATDTNDSIISLENQVNPAGAVGTLNDFDAGAPITVPVDDTTATMVYGRGSANSPVVSANFLANQFVGGGGQCKVVGTVVTSG
jgi:hypothetical protein